MECPLYLNILFIAFTSSNTMIIDHYLKHLGLHSYIITIKYLFKCYTKFRFVTKYREGMGQDERELKLITFRQMVAADLRL